MEIMLVFYWIVVPYGLFGKEKEFAAPTILSC